MDSAGYRGLGKHPVDHSLRFGRIRLVFTNGVPQFHRALRFCHLDLSLNNAATTRTHPRYISITRLTNRQPVRCIFL